MYCTLVDDIVFNTKYGEPIVSQGRLLKIWKAACKKAGIEDVTCYGGTRHSFVSQRFNAGKPKDLIGEFVGHATKQTTDKYAHVNLQGMRAVLDD